MREATHEAAGCILARALGRHCCTYSRGPGLPGRRVVRMGLGSDAARRAADDCVLDRRYHPRGALGALAGWNPSRAALVEALSDRNPRGAVRPWRNRPGGVRGEEA